MNGRAVFRSIERVGQPIANAWARLPGLLRRIIWAVVFIGPVALIFPVWPAIAAVAVALPLVAIPDKSRHWVNRSADPFFNCRRGSRAIIPKALALAAVALAIDQIDPFDLSSSMDEMSQRWILRVAGPLYGGPIDGGPGAPEAELTDPRDKVAVVLLDKAWVAGTGQGGWPPTMMDYLTLVTDLQDAGARAVFLDLQIVEREDRKDDRTGVWLADLRDQALDARPGSEHFLFAATSSEDGSAFTADRPRHDGKYLNSGLWWTAIAAAIQQAARPVYVHYAGFGGAYPLHMYSHERFPSPALALFREFCRTENWSRCPAQAGDWDEAQWQRFAAKTAREPMLVEWGHEPPDLPWRDLLMDKTVSFADDQHCPHSASDAFFDRLRESGETVFEGIKGAFKRDWAEYRSCPYLPYLPASVLQNGGADLKQAARSTIEDRVVFVGSGLAASNDQIPMPYGQVLGVFYHAQAFENLLRHGEDYLKTADHLQGVDVPGVVQVVLFVSLLFAGFKMGQWVEEKEDNALRLFRAVQSVALLGGVSFALALVLYGVFRWAPEIWIGALTVSLLPTAIAIVSHDEDCEEEESHAQSA